MSGVSKEEIHGWLERAKIKSASHLIVVLDKFSSEYYPVFVESREQVSKLVEEYDDKAKMSKVMEVYDLSFPWGEQLAARRAFNP